MIGAGNNLTQGIPAPKVGTVCSATWILNYENIQAAVFSQSVIYIKREYQIMEF